MCSVSPLYLHLRPMRQAETMIFFIRFLRSAVPFVGVF
jgi:hypothetical protein